MTQPQAGPPDGIPNSADIVCFLSEGVSLLVGAGLQSLYLPTAIHGLQSNQHVSLLGLLPSLRFTTPRLQARSHQQAHAWHQIQLSHVAEQGSERAGCSSFSDQTASLVIFVHNYAPAL